MDKEVILHTDNNADGVSNKTQHPSVVSIVWTMFDKRREAKAEPRGPRQPLRLNSISRHPDVEEDTLETLLDKKRSEDGPQNLIEFLHSTPPPENYMSIPDNYSTSSSEDRKWSKLSVFGSKKRKGKRKRRPPTIKLPDSAVAATTTGGHRHIAISIPFEHSHFGPISPTQYSVYDSLGADFAREMETRLETMRTFGSGRGVVTVLKPVAEDGESSSSGQTMPTMISSGQPGPRSPPRIPLRRHSMGSPHGERKSSARGMARSYSVQDHRAEVIAKPEPAARDVETPTSQLEDVSSRFESTVATPSTPTKPIFPSRQSNKNTSRRSVTGASIDKIINHGVSPSQSVKRGARSLVAESVSTQASESKTVHVPIVIRPPGWVVTDSPAKDHVPKPPPLKVDRSVQTDDTFAIHPTKDHAKSRKERVRERKQRDILSSRHGYIYSRDEKLSPESSTSEPFSDISATSSPTRPNPTPIDVAIDVLTGSPSSMSQTSPTYARCTSKAPSTPSTSPSTPSSVMMDLDRTPSRLLREQMAERNARYAAKIADEHKGSPKRSSRREFVHRFRYETLKDDHIRDMERRVRRLERNGEKWLQSMVPLMETLNKLLQEQYDYRHQEGLICVSPWRASMPTKPLSTLKGDKKRESKPEPERMDTGPDSSLERPPTLRSFRSYDSLLDQTIDRLSPTKPRHLSLTISTGSYGTTFLGASPVAAHRSSLSGHSLLQEEFEKALELRRTKERRVDEVDYMMRETERKRLAQKALVGDGSDGGASSDEMLGEDETEYATAETERSVDIDLDTPSDHGLDSLEPIMRELADATRFRVEDEQRRVRRIEDDETLEQHEGRRKGNFFTMC